MTQLTPEQEAEALAIAAQLRTRPAYHITRALLARLMTEPRSTTKWPRIGVGSVGLLLRGALAGRERGRPTLRAALRDPDFDDALLVALIDQGLVVRDVPQRWCDGRHLACNIREAVLWELFRSTRGEVP